MTRAAGVARSFPLVCFSADAFNFYPVQCCDTWGKPQSARMREENRKGVMEPWGKYWSVQSRVKTLQQQAYIIFSHMTQPAPLVLITHIYFISSSIAFLFVWGKLLFPLITTGLFGNMSFLKGQFAYFSLRVFARHADLIVICSDLSMRFHQWCFSYQKCAATYVSWKISLLYIMCTPCYQLFSLGCFWDLEYFCQPDL